MKVWRVPYPKYGAGPDLARVSRIAAALDVDLPAFGADAAIITGSNGKGSTAAMCAAILNQSEPTGLFTSPHLLALNERFRIGEEDISDDELERHWLRVVAAAERVGEADELRGFEFLFLVAADWFAARRCAHTIWEAGIGGRDDPACLIKPRRTALTSLELEHASLIGPALEDIARNKLDAAPAAAAVFISEICKPYREAIEAHCAARGLSPIWVGPKPEIAAPLAGDFQRSNAALAVALARDIAGDPLGDSMIARGLSTTRWPGRLEILERDPLIVIDVGHTPDGVRAAMAGFASLSGERPRTLVCGVSADKPAEPIIAALAPFFPRIICAAPQHKGRPAVEIAALTGTIAPDAEIVVADSVSEARRIALNFAGKDGCIYVAGGLFLAAEFKAAHLGRDPASLAFF